MTPDPSVSIKSGKVQARIALRGAELTSLQFAGREFLWQGDPGWWSSSAPLLFPVIGRLPDQKINHQGRTLHLPPHGFARDLPFRLEDAGPTHAELSLRASPATLDMYPFLFELRVRFQLGDDGLYQNVRVTNAGAEVMPASFGFHPAFCWPARQSLRAGHSVRFTHPESSAAYRVDKTGCLLPSTLHSDVHHCTLLLDDALFDQGAIVINPVESTGLEYRDQDGRLLAIEWSGCRQLGLWTLPGAPFICFEPWHGHPSPCDFTGELSEKPGGFQLEPGQAKAFQLSVTF